MKKLYRLLAQTFIFIVAIIIMAAPLSQKAYAVSPNTPWQKLTQSELTTVWWKWILSIPATGSPATDETGEHAYNGQPYSDLFFLAGTIVAFPTPSGDVLGKVTRNSQLVTAAHLLPLQLLSVRC